LTATFKSVRAAPVRSLRLCYQSWRVRGDTPSSCAKSRWDSPTLALASAAEGSLAFVTRAASPRRICLTDAKRSAWNFCTSDLSLAPFLNCARNAAGKLSNFALEYTTNNHTALSGARKQMTHARPLLPMPDLDHRTVRQPPDPRMMSPTSGFAAMKLMNSSRSRSDQTFAA
jgi:hypothetical protein